MSELEPFLSRWARRKREAEQEEPQARAAQEAPSPERDSAQKADAPTNEVAPATREDRSAPVETPAFDIGSLPSLESITASTDIRDFLRPGVPADLSRAALRRAWSADPAIRDFIGLSENAWDFNDPNAILGFGPLQATDDIRRLVAEVFGERPEAQLSIPHQEIPDQESVSSASQQIATEHQPSQPNLAQDTDRATAEPAADDDEPVIERHMIEQRADNTAVQHEADRGGDSQMGNDDTHAALQPRRAHGGALPQ